MASTTAPVTAGSIFTSIWTPEHRVEVRSLSTNETGTRTVVHFTWLDGLDRFGWNTALEISEFLAGWYR